MNMYSPVGSSKAVADQNRTPSDIHPISGLCAVCLEDCIGKCEVGQSAIRGPEVIYPRPFGDLTAAGIKRYPVNWGHFNIQGTAVGAYGIEADSDQAIFPNVKLEVRLGANNGQEGLKLRCPTTVPGLGSTDVARKNWPGLAAGTAYFGVILTIGENIVGMDPAAEISNSKVIKSPNLDKRISDYKKWQRDGYGAIVAQENVEDRRLGVLEYAISKGIDAAEIKWGQGAKDIGGEVKIDNLEIAQMLAKRGYIVLPDPLNPKVVEAFNRGSFREFERHSRIGMVDEEDFEQRSQELRDAGAKYIFLKTGAYRFADLARAVAWSSKYGVNVLTIDGSGGGTGMSPWRMMNEWGITPIELFQKAYEYTSKLAAEGKHVADLVFAGGFSLEDHIFKGLAFGAPFVKAIGMARAPLTAVMVSKKIWSRISDDSNQAMINQYGRHKEQVFYAGERVKDEIGRVQFEKEFPVGGLGAIDLYMRDEQGLKQLMTGARKFDLSKQESSPDRKDLVALTEEAAKRTGIDFIMDHDAEEVEAILSEALR